MLNILLAAIALGLLWAIMTIGVFLTYRVLDIADLTVEGSIVLGAAVAAVMIYHGMPPFLATITACLAGAVAGLITGLLHTKLKIPALLAGILSMIALYSINIRVMLGSANISLLRKATVFTPLMDVGLSKNLAVIVTGLAVAILVVAAIYWFYNTEIGCAIRATGSNGAMARAQGIPTDATKIAGLSISNGLVGLSGGLIAQYLGFADVQMGVGAIVIGLASVIIGEVLFGTKTFRRTLIALVCGAVTYRMIIALVFEAGMPATDLKLFTAITVAIALALPRLKQRFNFPSWERKGVRVHVARGKRNQDV